MGCQGSDGRTREKVHLVRPGRHQEGAEETALRTTATQMTKGLSGVAIP